MTRITFVDSNGMRRTVDAKVGQTVMQAAVRNNIEAIVAECGGSCACATCRVYVDDELWRAKTGMPSEIERTTLNVSGDKDPRVRLSCQIRVTDSLDGITFRTPETQFQE